MATTVREWLIKSGTLRAPAAGPLAVGDFVTRCGDDVHRVGKLDEPPGWVELECLVGVGPGWCEVGATSYSKTPTVARISDRAAGEVMTKAEAKLYLWRLGLLPPAEPITTNYVFMSGMVDAFAGLRNDRRFWLVKKNGQRVPLTGSPWATRPPITRPPGQLCGGDIAGLIRKP
jgi:hypothetical protein